MHIRIDESGDFNYDTETRFWVSVLAGVVIPDRSWRAVENFVNQKTTEWSVAELKAKDMSDKQLEEVARFFVAESLVLSAIATDSSIFTAASQREWRGRQADVVRAAKKRSTRVNSDPDLRERVDALERRLPSERHIALANFLQYGILSPWLIGQLLSASLYAYEDLPPDADSWVMDVVVDGKRGADPGKPGDLIRNIVEPIFVSDERTSLFIPRAWPKDHPFYVKNTDDEVNAISPRKLLGTGIRPGDSDADPGLQLADFVAHVIWTLLVNPDDAGANTAWSVLAPNVIPTPQWFPIKVWAYPGDNLTEDQMARYERLRGRWNQALRPRPPWLRLMARLSDWLRRLMCAVIGMTSSVFLNIELPHAP